MAMVMLKAAEGGFRRSVRKPDGSVSHVLVFLAGQPIDLSADELEAVKGDIANGVLGEVNVNPAGQAKPVEPEAEVSPPEEIPPEAPEAAETAEEPEKRRRGRPRKETS